MKPCETMRILGVVPYVPYVHVYIYMCVFDVFCFFNGTNWRGKE